MIFTTNLSSKLLIMSDPHLQNTQNSVKNSQLNEN